MNPAVNCPYCDQPMVCGKLYGVESRGVYWLPSGTKPSDMKGWCLTQKRIHAAGGIVLDQLFPIGFIAKDRPDSFYCEACHIFLTKELP